MKTLLPNTSQPILRSVTYTEEDLASEDLFVLHYIIGLGKNHDGDY